MLFFDARCVLQVLDMRATLANKKNPNPAVVLFLALPFVSVGLAMVALLVQTLWTWVQVRSWVEIPCQIAEVELETTKHSGRTSYQVKALYDYSFNGESFTGTRVGIHQGFDNFGGLPYLGIQQAPSRPSCPCFVSLLCEC